MIDFMKDIPIIIDPIDFAIYVLSILFIMFLVRVFIFPIFQGLAILLIGIIWIFGKIATFFIILTAAIILGIKLIISRKDESARQELLTEYKRNPAFNWREHRKSNRESRAKARKTGIPPSRE